MKKDELHRYLLKALEKKIPDKSKLVEMLMETLFMEKGAVYRRLRGEVPFSFFEVVNITEKLDISLNSLIHDDSVRKDHFELTFVEYTNMNEMDYKQWEDFITFVRSAKNDPHSEKAESSNILPICIYGGFDSLSKYYLFKYQYRLHESEGRIVFSELVVPDRLHRMFRTDFDESKNIAHTTYLLDNNIFRNLVTDIHFFSTINSISADDLQQIKEDLFALLDYLEKIALTGCFEETGNPVSIYISDVNLEAAYVCMQINNTHTSIVRNFILNYVESIDQSSYRKIKNWIQSQKKSSTLITQSGAVYRADFFGKQRKIVSEL